MPRPSRAAGAVVVTLAALVPALALALAVAAPASAHTALVGSSPQEGSTVIELTEVSLEFSEQLLEIGHELVLEAPDGTRTALEVDAPVTSTITAPVPDGALGEGANLLVWRVVAGDGHPIEGAIGFTYAPEPDPTVTTPAPTTSSLTTSTPTPDATGSASATPSATASSVPGAGAEEEGAPWPWLLGGAGLVVVGAAAVAFVSRARHRDD